MLIRSDHIVARKGHTQLDAGQMCISCMCHSNRKVSHTFIFPRKRVPTFHTRRSSGKYRNCKWFRLDATLLYFLIIFVKHAKPDKKHPVLLLLDNHDSHILVQS